MREQRGVRQHLVVHVGVEIGHLHDAVEGEHAAEPGRLEQHHFLVLRAALLEHVEHVVGRVRRAAGLELLEPPRLELGRHAAGDVAGVDVIGFEGFAQHADDRVDVGAVAAREEVGGEVAVLGPRVQGQVALGDHRDPRHAVRRELVDEDFDEGHATRVRGVRSARSATSTEFRFEAPQNSQIAWRPTPDWSTFTSVEDPRALGAPKSGTLSPDAADAWNRPAPVSTGTTRKP